MAGRTHVVHPDVRFLDARGERFAYLTWGEGPLVLLVHGFPDTAHTWDVLGPELARAGFRVVAPFLRGYAPSVMAERDVDARRLGEDVLAWLDALDAPRSTPARVVGHDWGAEAVYAAAALAPERIARMVSVAIPHRAGITLTPSLFWSLRHVVSLQLPGAEERFARDDFAMIETLWRRWSPTWRYDASDLEPVKNTFAAPGCVHSALGYYRAATVSTPAFMRAKVAVPTLAVAGGDDPGVSPDVFRAAKRHFTGPYDVSVIPGGHFCHRESAAAFADAVVRFLRG